jgi:hypothetical protein
VGHARVRVPSDVSIWIAEKIRTFPGDRSAHQWAAERVQEMDALPLVLGMGGTYAIRASGDLVQFDWDGPGGAEPIDDPRLINVALYQGSLKYPQLLALVPSRPIGARDCSHCEGRGRPAIFTKAGFENLICYCGGVGWLP